MTVSQPEPLPLRLYDSVRTAHLERFAVMVPADVLFNRQRYDFDEAVLRPGQPRPRRATRWQVMRELARGRRPAVETNEPLMVSRWPDLLLQHLAVRLGALSGRPRARTAAYCIGLTDPVDELARRLPRPVARLLARLVLGVLVRATDRLALGTTGCRDLMSRYVPSAVLDRHARVFPALPTPCPCPEASGRDPRQVLFVGALVPRKGVSQLMAAWEALGDGAGGLRLDVLGKGAMHDEVERWAASRPEVRVVLDPPRAAIHEAQRRAHVVVLLSQRVGAWREQVGLPLVEGLAHGCEVVTTTETGLAGWLEQAGHRVLSPAAAPTQVAEALVGAAQSSRPASAVLAMLPATDGRVEADAWMLGRDGLSVEQHVAGATSGERSGTVSTSGGSS